MKKILIIILVTLFLVQPAFAQSRGLLTNVWTSWVNVTATAVTLTFPSNSRDIMISNGDANDPVCVDLRGNTLANNCYAGTNTAIQVGPLDSITLSDFATSSVLLRAQSAGTAASPVSVVVTY